MNRFIYRALAAVVILVLLYLAGAVLVIITTAHIDNTLERSPPHATRAQVRQVLKHFRETEVSYTDIPASYVEARQLARLPGHTVYRYYFVIRYFSVHVIYDPGGRVVGVVETYE